MIVASAVADAGVSNDDSSSSRSSEKLKTLAFASCLSLKSRGAQGSSWTVRHAGEVGSGTCPYGNQVW